MEALIDFDMKLVAKTDELSEAGLPLYMLLQPICIEIFGFTFRVPLGFKTDFASIPKFLRFLISPTTPWLLLASVMHDYVYSMHILILERYGISKPLSRLECDLIFLMIALETVSSHRSPYKIIRYAVCYIGYFGIRVFGKSNFKIKRAETL